MPSPELAWRKQHAVLWPATGVYDAQGQALVGTPQQLRVRWVYHQTEMEDPQRNTITVDATVILGNIDVPVDSILWEGKLEDFAGTAGPLDQTPSGLMQVKAFSHTPNIKHQRHRTRRKVGVVRFRGTLPVGAG